MDQQQQNQLLQGQQIAQLQEQVQQLLPLQQQVQQLQQQNQQQQEQIEQFQQQQAEESESDDDDEDEVDDDDPLVMGHAMLKAFHEGHLETVSSLLDAGKDVNCTTGGQTPVMLALFGGHLHVAIMLAGRGG
jgi:ankyrin repeat protein